MREGAVKQIVKKATLESIETTAYKEAVFSK